MMEIVNFEVLALVCVASAILATLVELIKERLRSRWEALSDRAKENVGLGLILLSAALMWLTGLNMLPGFSRVWEPAGRILTCVIAGLGPGAVYKMWMDKPTAPTHPQPPLDL